MSGFFSIVLTSPEMVCIEAQAIQMLLESQAADFVHIRKPYHDIESMRKLLSEINHKYYDRLRLHDNYTLAEEFGLAGIHLNGRNKNYNNIKDFSVTASCHSIDEVKEKNFCDYVTLSPIYDSISKSGYLANTNLLNEVRANSRSFITKVVALGGVTPEKFSELSDFGFGGAALLGYIWEAKNQVEFQHKINEVVKYKKELK